MQIELHTLGYVVDNLKSHEYAIKVLGNEQGRVLYISKSETLCCDEMEVYFDMSHKGDAGKQWAIVGKVSRYRYEY